MNLDIRLIERLLDNLVENALHHTGASGTIVVRCVSTAHGLAVHVEDSGEGIHPEDLPHIFERFYRGRRANGALSGAGMGLAISRRMAEMPHVPLSVTNTPELALH